MNSIKDKFSELDRPNQMIRISADHPLDFYIAYDEFRNRTLVLKTETKLNNIKSTNSIRISNKVDKNGNNFLLISQLNIVIEDIFYKFCEDVIDATNLNAPKKELIKILYNRINLWKLAFSNPNSKILSESVIRGLIGEIYFLSNYMIKNYGIEKAVLSWTGPKKTKRDFEIGDYWFEVKTKSSSSDLVKITNVDQLDLPLEGKLAVASIDSTKLTSEKTYSLNDIILELYELAYGQDLDEYIFQNLLKAGYSYNVEYDQYRYLITDLSLYSIDEETPILRKNQLLKSIKSVSYKLDLNFLIKVDE